MIYKIALSFSVLFLLSDLVLATSGRVMTDRDIYVSGEEVLADVFVPDDCQFKIIRLNLTNSAGALMQTANLPLRGFRAAGHVYLPDSLPSGSYLITAYSPEVECQALESKEILVLNRFENTDEPISLDRAELPTMSALPLSGYQVLGLKESYGQDETVELNIRAKKEAGSLLAVSVGRCLPGWEPMHRLNAFEKTDTIQQIRKNGVVLQGEVRRLDNGEPVAGATVYLSILDSIPYFDYCQTQANGHFHFLLSNRYGVNKVRLLAEKEGETDELQIVPDPVGGMEYKGFSASTLAMDEGLRNYLNEAIQLVTFRKIYQTPDIVVQSVSNKPAFPFPFYGQPTMTINPDDYFELGDFSEISKELLQAVRFRHRNDQYRLDVIDYDLSTFMTGKPMILVDGVPLNDLSRLAPMGSKVIKRIEVVPYQRFYGDLSMDGVVAIYTKSGDASAIPASAHMVKMDFEALQTDVALPRAGKTEENAPNFQQLLYWNPEFNPSSDDSIRFTTPNVNGTYRVYLLERNDDGQLFERTEYFTVSDTL